jgi:probable HAF family extracellular repeat protein
MRFVCDPQRYLFGKGVAMRLSDLLRCAFLLFLVTTASLCFAQTYSMKDLGTISGMDYSVARGINKSAQVTGASGVNGTYIAHAFVNTAGSFVDFGTLGGQSAIGNGINALGQIAGYSENGAGAYRAFISSGKSLVDIGDLGGGSAVAYAINDAGQVVGSAVTADGSNHPFLYSNGKMADLGTLGSPEGGQWWNSAQGINNFGVVVGTSYTAHDGFRGFIWSSGKMIEMGTLGGSFSQAYAINNKGRVTGIAYTASGNAHAFRTRKDGSLKDLGSIDGPYGTTWGLAINDLNVVVGQGTYQGTYHAFVYNGLGMRDLNKLVPPGSGWVLLDAHGINNAGQIVCTGMRSDGTEHAFLLTPQ